MAVQNVTDKYANLAAGSVTESAAGTITFARIYQATAIFEKMAWVIHRIEYIPAAGALRELAAESDLLYWGLTLSDNMTAFDFEDPDLIDFKEIVPSVLGTAATQINEYIPMVTDFSGLPSGGVIVPPQNLYIGIKSTGFGSAAEVTVRVYFTYRKLKPEEYWQLVEARRVLS